MKKIMTGITLAALFAVPQPVKAGEKWYHMTEQDKEIAKATGIVLGGLTAATAGFVLFANWLSKPTSKNLFAMADELEKKVNQVTRDMMLIKKDVTAPHALKHINDLLMEVNAITSRQSDQNSAFKRLTKNAITEKTKRDFIALSSSDNNDKITMEINLKGIAPIIKTIKDAAQKVQKAEQIASKNRWYKRAWRRVTGQKTLQE